MRRADAGRATVIAVGYRGTGLLNPHRRECGQAEVPVWKEESWTVGKPVPRTVRGTGFPWLGVFLAQFLPVAEVPLRAGSWPQSLPAHLLSQSVKSASYLEPMVSWSRLYAASYSPAR